MARVRGKDRIELRSDPPPDLVVEIDVTHPSLPKLPIYAAFGVPEVWRYDGSRMQILLLRSGHYVESAESPAPPGIRRYELSRLIAGINGTDRTEWLRGVRRWARGPRTGDIR